MSRIISKPASPEYRDNYNKVFNKPNKVGSLEIWCTLCACSDAEYFCDGMSNPARKQRFIGNLGIGQGASIPVWEDDPKTHGVMPFIQFWTCTKCGRHVWGEALPKPEWPKPFDFNELSYDSHQPVGFSICESQDISLPNPELIKQTPEGTVLLPQGTIVGVDMGTGPDKMAECLLERDEVLLTRTDIDVCKLVENAASEGFQKELNKEMFGHEDGVAGLLAGDKVKCDNCAWVGSENDLQFKYPDIPNVLDRMDPGGVVPAGICPGVRLPGLPIEGEQR